MLVADHPTSPTAPPGRTDVAPAVVPPRARPSGAPGPVALAGVVALVPLLVDPAGWYVYLTLRWAVLTVLVVVALGLLAWRGRLRSPAGGVWWLGLVGVAVVSALASDAPWVALTGASDRRLGAMTWAAMAGAAVVGASVVRDRRSLRVLGRGVTVAALVAAVVTALQQAGLDWPAGAVNDVRPGGPFGNAGFLGAFAVLALLVAVGAALDGDEPDRWRTVHVAGATAAAFCLVVCGARASWLGAVVGLTVVGVALARRHGASRRATAALTVTLVLLVVGLLLLAGAGPRLASAADAADGRVATWEVALRATAERPLLGWGPEGLAQGFGRSATATWESSYGRRLVPDRAHNGLIDVAATLGIAGLVVYLGLLGSTARTIARGFRRGGVRGHGPAVPFTVVGVAAALVGYLVQQQFLFQLPDVDLLVAVLAGALAGLAVGDARRVPNPGPPRLRRFAPSAVVSAVGLVVLVSATAVVGARAVQADRDARQSSDRRSVGAAVRSLERDPQVLPALALADAALSSAGQGQSADDIGAARRRLGVVRSATFDDGRLTLARARLARAGGLTADLAESELEVQELLDLDAHRADGWAELGELRAAQLDPAGAAAAFERAVGLRPDRTDAWLGLARASMDLGDVGRAAEAISRVPVDQLDAGGMALRSAASAGVPAR